MFEGMTLRGGKSKRGRLWLMHNIALAVSTERPIGTISASASRSRFCTWLLRAARPVTSGGYGAYNSTSRLQTIFACCTVFRHSRTAASGAWRTKSRPCVFARSSLTCWPRSGWRPGGAAKRHTTVSMGCSRLCRTCIVDFHSVPSS